MCLYNDLIKKQNFGLNDEYKINKRKELFNDDLKLITNDLKVYLHRIEYSYKTSRGNNKENYKVVVLNEIDKPGATVKFLDCIEETNKEFPYRKILNVKILNIRCEEMTIPLI